MMCSEFYRNATSARGKFLYLFFFLFESVLVCFLLFGITLGEEGVYFILYHWGKPGQVLKAGALGLELWQSPWRDAAFWFASTLTLSYLSYLTQDYLSGTALPGVGPPPSVRSWESAPQTLPTDQSDGGSPSAGAPPLRHSSCVELTETNQQSYKVVSPLSEIDPI